MAHTRHRAHPCPDPSTGLRLAQLSLLQLHVPTPRSNVSSSIRNRPRNATDRRDEEAKAHEAARGQSPPLRGSCSWKTPPLTASFLTSQRSQTGALPAPAFLLESLPSARQPRDANDRGDEAKPGRTHESCRHKTEKGPKAPPAGRPSAGTAQGGGCREQPGSACTREPPEEPPAASRQPSSRNPNQEPKQGRSRGRGRTTASAGREAPGRDAALSRRSHSESGALREGSHRSQAASTAPSRSSSRQPSGAGTAASPPAAARGQPPPRAAPPRSDPPAPPPSHPSCPPRRVSRAARRALSEGPARSPRTEGRKDSRAARTHRPPSLRRSSRTERTQRPPHPDPGGSDRRTRPRPLGAAQGRSARPRPRPPQPSSGRNSAARPHPLSDAERPRALLFKHSGPRDWPGG